MNNDFQMAYTVTNAQGDVIAVYAELDEISIFLIENAGLYVTETLIEVVE